MSAPFPDVGTSAADAIAMALSTIGDVVRAEVIDVPHRDRPKPRWDITDRDRDALSEAKELRQQHGVPYWEAVLLRFEQREIPIPAPVIAATGLHHGVEDETFRLVDIDNEGLRFLRSLSEPRDDGGFWAIRSAVTLRDGTRAHLPMMDFRISTSSGAAVETITRVMRHLRTAGFLVQTDRSYHFVALQTVSPNELNEFLVRASLFGPVVDQRWIAHQQLDGACALRLSARPDGVPLRVIKTIDVD